MDLSHKSILITGGNSGIGMQLVKQLHARGNEIIVASRSNNNWDELRQLQPPVKLVQCDLSSRSQVLRLHRQFEEQGVALDVLINCAAVQNTPMLTEKEFNFESIEIEVATNFMAPVWLSFLCLPEMSSRPGAMIVNLSSGLAFFPKSTSAVYCATKAALHNFSQALRYQLANTSVRVVEVILPLVDTPMTCGRGRWKISSSQAARKIIRGIEKQREEIYIGKARMLPLIMRVWPQMLRRILRSY